MNENYCSNTNWAPYTRGYNLTLGHSSQRPFKSSLGPWNFSDSSLAGYCNFEYFICKISCWSPIIFVPAKATAAKMLSFIPPLILLLNKSDNATKVHPIHVLCVGVIVFNATSNNISAISWQSVLLVSRGNRRKTTDLSQVTDKHHACRLIWNKSWIWFSQKYKLFYSPANFANRQSACF